MTDNYKNLDRFGSWVWDFFMNFFGQSTAFERIILDNITYLNSLLISFYSSIDDLLKELSLVGQQLNENDFSSDNYDNLNEIQINREAYWIKNSSSPIYFLNLKKIYESEEYIFYIQTELPFNINDAEITESFQNKLYVGKTNAILILLCMNLQQQLLREEIINHVVINEDILNEDIPNEDIPSKELNYSIQICLIQMTKLVIFIVY